MMDMAREATLRGHFSMAIEAARKGRWEECYQAITDCRREIEPPSETRVERYDPFVVRILIALEHKAFGRAHRIVLEAVHALDDEPGPVTPAELWTWPIGSMPLSLRAVNSLENHGIDELGQLLALPVEVLRAFAGFGPCMLREVVEGVLVYREILLQAEQGEYLERVNAWWRLILGTGEVPADV